MLALCVLGLASGRSIAASNPAAPAQAHQITVQLLGVVDPYYTYGVEEELLAVPGIAQVTIDLEKSRAMITLKRGAQVSDQQLRDAVYRAGFEAGAIRRPAPAPGPRP